MSWVVKTFQSCQTCLGLIEMTFCSPVEFIWMKLYCLWMFSYHAFWCQFFGLFAYCSSIWFCFSRLEKEVCFLFTWMMKWNVNVGRPVKEQLRFISTAIIHKSITQPDHQYVFITTVVVHHRIYMISDSQACLISAPFYPVCYHRSITALLDS